MVRAALTVLFIAASVVGCKPKLEGRPSLIDGDRVLAVRSIPAEAKPGAAVRYEALYVGTDAALDPMDLDFALCNARKPLAVTGPIAPSCLARSGKSLTPLAAAEQPETMLSPDVCRAFGPIAPAPKAGEPPSRPSDPDTTGGYYQPVRVRAHIEGRDEYTVGVTRLDCGLAGATQEQASQYAQQHRPNENPALESVETRGAGRVELAAEGEGNPLGVRPGATLSLRASWAACPKKAVCGDGICSPGEDPQCDDCKGTTVQGCTGAEPYLVLDAAQHALVQKREAIRVSWFATDGDFEHDRTGRAEADTETYSENRWTAPKAKGDVHMHVVIRDDRGGVAWKSFVLSVNP